jgi:hypothetical protein
MAKPANKTQVGISGHIHPHEVTHPDDADQVHDRAGPEDDPTDGLGQ